MCNHIRRFTITRNDFILFLRGAPRRIRPAEITGNVLLARWLAIPLLPSKIGPNKISYGRQLR